MNQCSFLWTRIPISRLFNFTTDSWSSRYARFVALTFEEELELELYDLLEMDAEGHNPDDDNYTRRGIWNLDVIYIWQDSVTVPINHNFS